MLARVYMDTDVYRKVNAIVFMMYLGSQLWCASVL